MALNGLTGAKVMGIMYLQTPRSAEVVELVDALRSGRSGCTPVGVRLPPSAPYKNCVGVAELADAYG